MTSFQQSAGAGKAAKFVAANPLAPMADPFRGMEDDQKEYHKELAENVNARLQTAMENLVQRHANGTNEFDHPDRAPTGNAYHAAQLEQIRRQRLSRLQAESNVAGTHTSIRAMGDLEQRAKAIFAENHANDDLSDENSILDSEDEYDDLLQDPELDRIRQRRMEEIRQKQSQEALYRSLGHGQVRTIHQDEFLPECTGQSEYVVVHFFHKDFERCKIMDHHLSIVATKHMECKFLRIDAEKAPFFVDKLKVRTLPALIVFREGKAIDRLTGFEGLALSPNEPDKWQTSRLEKWIADTKAIKYEPSLDERTDEMEAMRATSHGKIWSGTGLNGYRSKRFTGDEEND